MREIKFRVWDKENKEMLSVQELDYKNSYNGQPMIRPTKYNDYYDTEDMILMQYTGLKDKNGVEIYEGDIVSCYNRNFIVEYRKERGGFSPFACGDGCGCCEDEVILSYSLEMSARVIGNIYDNPELLKESD